MGDFAQMAGSVTKGVAGYESGKWNKKAAYQSALQAEMEGADAELRVRHAARGAIGEQVAAQGESGFQIGTGSALDALMQSQVNATLDALTVRRQAALKAQSLRTQGKIAMAQGMNALVSGLIGAGGQAASAFSSPDWAGSSAPSQGGYDDGGYGQVWGMPGHEDIDIGSGGVPGF